MRITFKHKGRRELFSVGTEYSHSPRPVGVNRGFHAFARGETMDFPDFFSPWQRRTGWAVDKLATGYSSLLISWLDGESTLEGLAETRLESGRTS